MAGTCMTTYSVTQKDSLQVINKSTGFAVSAFHIYCCSPEKQPRRRRLALCSGQSVRSNSFLSLHIFQSEFLRLIWYEFLVFFLGRTIAAINELSTKPVFSFIFHFFASLRSCDLFLQAAWDGKCGAEQQRGSSSTVLGQWDTTRAGAGKIRLHITGKIRPVWKPLSTLLWEKKKNQHCPVWGHSIEAETGAFQKHEDIRKEGTVFHPKMRHVMKAVKQEYFP